jgi:hypothetical protein
MYILSLYCSTSRYINYDSVGIYKHFNLLCLNYTHMMHTIYSTYLSTCLVCIFYNSKKDLPAHLNSCYYCFKQIPRIRNSQNSKSIKTPFEPKIIYTCCQQNLQHQRSNQKTNFQVPTNKKVKAAKCEART